ncbi:MAG: ABC transporter permease subunit [Candidatus Eremiobacteraeota bacterium]|nr:ABC transporter permease subunit [Candidatus Eremiobacteraeota bacterium]
MPILIIASLVLREIVRRRLAAAILLMTGVLMVLSAWGFLKITHVNDSSGHPLSTFTIVTIASVLTLMMAFMFTVILALGAAFLGTSLVGTEIENGLMLAVLPRPLGRSQLLIGKWLGASCVLIFYGLLAAAAELGIIKSFTGYSPPHPIAGLAFLLAQVLAVLTLTIALSVKFAPITAGFITVVAFGLAWVDGIIHVVAVTVNNTALAHATLALTLLIPTDGLWRGAIYNLAPAAMLAASASTPGSMGPFSVAGPPVPAYLLWCAFWIVAVLATGITLFRTRDV